MTVNRPRNRPRFEWDCNGFEFVSIPCPGCRSLNLEFIDSHPVQLASERGVRALMRCLDCRKTICMGIVEGEHDHKGVFIDIS